MPFQIRIHIGTLNIIGCDIDGYANPAVHGVGDSGPTTVTIVDSQLGATRYDSNGAQSSWGPGSVQASKPQNVAPDRVNLALTRVKFDPDVETHGGKSILLGSTVTDQFTQSGSAFRESGVGSPATKVFEDFPTIRGAGGIPSALTFGSPTVIRGAAFVRPIGIASALAFGSPTVTRGAVAILPTGIGSALAFGVPHVFISRGPTQTVVPTGIASALAFGVPTLVRGARLVQPTGIPSQLAIGVPTVRRGPVALSPTGISSALAWGLPRIGLYIRPGGIPSALAFGSPIFTVHARTIQPSGIPSALTFGVPRLSMQVRALGIPSALAFGVPVLLRATRVITPTGIASALAWGVPRVVTNSVISGAGGIPSALAFGAPTVGNNSGGVIRPQGIPSALAWGVPSFVRPYGISPRYQRIVTRHDVQDAVINTLRGTPDGLYMDGWLITYLAELERQNQLPAQTLATPQSWQQQWTFEQWPADATPGIYVVVGEMEANPTRFGDGNYRAAWPVQIVAVVQSTDQTGVDFMLAMYTSAIRTAMLQHGSLGNFALATEFVSETYDTVDESASRTIGAGTVSFRVVVDNVVNDIGVDATPPTEPYGPPAGFIQLTDLSIETDLVEEEV